MRLSVEPFGDTELRILIQLSDFVPKSTPHLCKVIGKSKYAIWHSCERLRRRGFLIKERIGREVYWVLNAKKISKVKSIVLTGERRGRGNKRYSSPLVDGGGLGLEVHGVFDLFGGFLGCSRVPLRLDWFLGRFGGLGRFALWSGEVGVTVPRGRVPRGFRRCDVLFRCVHVYYSRGGCLRVHVSTGRGHVLDKLLAFAQALRLLHELPRIILGACR